MTTTTGRMTIEEAIDSNLWTLVVGARDLHALAYLRFLWNRQVWRQNPRGCGHLAAFREAEREYTASLVRMRQVERAGLERLRGYGVDTEKLPHDLSRCRLCRCAIVEGHGCGCTNVDEARRHGRPLSRDWAG